MFTPWSILNLNYNQNSESTKITYLYCKLLYRLALKNTPACNQNWTWKGRSLERRTFLSLKSLQHRLIAVTLFRLSKSLYSQSVLFKRTNHFGSVFPNRLDRRIYEINTRLQFFPFFVSCNTLNFSFDAQYFAFVRDRSHVVTLTVSCRGQLCAKCGLP